jgi:DHA1 family bicyclomycin/chloramphenicol resistance-like MFS transporter
MSRDVLRLALILGLATAVGLFAVDMYLPALPTIGASLKADPAAVQMSLMVFFITVGLFQIVFGAVSDVVGRKGPFYAGLAVFALGSVGCALASSMSALIAFRIVQAFGACAGMVLPRAMIRDLHTGPDATRLMSLLMLVTSISPMLAPLVGSLILGLASWRVLFWVIAVAAVAALVLVATQLEETRPAAQQERSWGRAFGAYRLSNGTQSGPPIGAQ